MVGVGCWTHTGSSQKGAAVGAQGPAYQLLPEVSVGRVLEFIELLQARGGEQNGAVVREGVEGELAVISSHATVTCMSTEVRA